MHDEMKEGVRLDKFRAPIRRSNHAKQFFCSVVVFFISVWTRNTISFDGTFRIAHMSHFSCAIGWSFHIVSTFCLFCCCQILTIVIQSNPDHRRNVACKYSTTRSMHLLTLIVGRHNKSPVCNWTTQFFLRPVNSFNLFLLNETFGVIVCRRIRREKKPRLNKRTN